MFQQVKMELRDFLYYSTFMEVMVSLLIGRQQPI
jgi:hypothetical protein